MASRRARAKHAEVATSLEQLLAVREIVVTCGSGGVGKTTTAAALGAMLGGVASNGLDRLRFGMGVDFLHPGPVGSDVLPDFNFADIAIVLGLVTLIAELLATELATRAAERPRP